MSSYNGLSVALRRPFSNGLLVTANYMWSHEIDNGSNGSGDGDEISPQNPLCLACDRASGAWDATHVVNGNAVYQLPFGHGKPMLNQGGIASAIAGNWELTTTALARTGFPVNVLMPSSYTAPDGASGTERPDLVPGVSLTPPGGKERRRVDQSRGLCNSRQANSAPRRATCFAGRAPGRSIWAPARRFHWGNAGGLNSARSSTTSSITRS
jgi:hypothetical protein